MPFARQFDSGVRHAGGGLLRALRRLRGSPEKPGAPDRMGISIKLGRFLWVSHAGIFQGEAKLCGPDPRLGNNCRCGRDVGKQIRFTFQP